MAHKLIAPELDHPSQIELANHIMRLYQRVHISLKTLLCVYTLLVEFNFNEVIWVCSDDEVDLCPVDHYYFFHIVNDVWKLLRRQSF